MASADRPVSSARRHRSHGNGRTWLQGVSTLKAYTVNEIFYSLQGEGIRAGSANLFLRFTGCNETCQVESHGFDCDTEFTSGRKLTLDEIIHELRDAGTCP